MCYPFQIYFNTIKLLPITMLHIIKSLKACFPELRSSKLYIVKCTLIRSLVTYAEYIKIQIKVYYSIYKTL